MINVFSLMSLAGIIWEDLEWVMSILYIMRLCAMIVIVLGMMSTEINAYNRNRSLRFHCYRGLYTFVHLRTVMVQYDRYSDSTLLGRRPE